MFRYDEVTNHSFYQTYILLPLPKEAMAQAFPIYCGIINSNLATLE